LKYLAGKDAQATLAKYGFAAPNDSPATQAAHSSTRAIAK
jgi:hypothetical protein